MKKIKIRQYTPPQLKFFGPNSEFIGFINNYEEFLRVRVDIAEIQASGYYFTYGKTKIEILPNGDMTNWLFNIYQEKENLLDKLFNLNNNLENLKDL